MKKSTYESISYLLTISVIGTMVFLLLFFCVKTFDSIDDSYLSNNKKRAVCSYLTNIIESYNTQGSIQIKDDGKMLVLSESDGKDTYELRIFLYNGKLVEYYCLENQEIDFDNISEIAENKKLQFSYVNDQLLKINTDFGDIYVKVVK